MNERITQFSQLSLDYGPGIEVRHNALTILTPDLDDTRLGKLIHSVDLIAGAGDWLIGDLCNWVLGHRGEDRLSALASMTGWAPGRVFAAKTVCAKIPADKRRLAFSVYAAILSVPNLTDQEVWTWIAKADAERLGPGAIKRAIHEARNPGLRDRRDESEVWRGVFRGFAGLGRLDPVKMTPIDLTAMRDQVESLRAWLNRYDSAVKRIG